MYANTLAMSCATAVVLGVPSLAYLYIYCKPLPNYKSLVMHYSAKVNDTDIFSLSFLFSRRRTGIGNTAAYVTSV